MFKCAASARLAPVSRPGQYGDVDPSRMRPYLWDAVAEGRTEAGMTRGEMIIARRTEERQGRALAAWAWLEGEMLSLGVKPTLFGSLAKGRFKAHSDIDITVDLKGNAIVARIAVERAVALACERWGVPVDLLFEEDLSAENVAMLHAA